MILMDKEIENKIRFIIAKIYPTEPDEAFEALKRVFIPDKKDAVFKVLDDIELAIAQVYQQTILLEEVEPIYKQLDRAARTLEKLYDTPIIMELLTRQRILRTILQKVRGETLSKEDKETISHILEGQGLQIEKVDKFYKKITKALNTFERLRPVSIIEILANQRSIKARLLKVYQCLPKAV